MAKVGLSKLWRLFLEAKRGLAVYSRFLKLVWGELWVVL